MSFPTKSYTDTFGPDGLFWPPGRTPAFLDICFSGIQKGTGHTSGMREPMNGIILLKNIGGVLWPSVQAPLGVEVYLSEDATYVAIDEDSPEQQFRYDQAIPGISAADNELIDPAAAFYGGKMVISSHYAGTGPSMEQTMLEFGIEPDVDTFYNFGPTAGSGIFQRFTRKRDGSCLYVKRSIP
jgi:hypothetical protein